MERIASKELEVLLSEEGAELRSLRKDGLEFLWQGDDLHWKRHAPLLFPFVGRNKGRRYFYNGSAYEMGVHGFAASSIFTVSERNEDSIVFTLSADDDTRRIYPFDFTLSVRYSAEGRTLREDVFVRNEGKGRMLYGIGFHPGFNVPLEKGLLLSDYKVVFPFAEKELHQRTFSPDGLEVGYDVKPEAVSDGCMHLRHDLFLNDAIVLRGTGSRCIVESGKGSHRITVDYDSPWIGLWQSIQEDTPFLCIEPWYTLPGRVDTDVDISLRNDFFCLEPGGEKVHGISITID